MMGPDHQEWVVIAIFIAWIVVALLVALRESED